MPIGIIALSYAKRAEEPNPVNHRLAYIVNTLREKLSDIGLSTVTVSQHEIALALYRDPDLIVTQDDATNLDRNGDLYLSSQDVINKAVELFREKNINSVVVVANPFIHLDLVKSLLNKEAGLRVLDYKIEPVGFDSSPLNLQWWSKGPVQFTAYLAIQAFGKLTGRNLRGIGGKKPAVSTSPH